MKYNCPNCGVVVNPDIRKCPYCGVQYLDVSHIDFDEKVPIVLKLKVGKGDEATYVTQLVLPAVDMERRYNEQEITGPYEHILAIISTGINLHTNLSFDSKPMYDGSTAIVENKEMKTIWK